MPKNEAGEIEAGDSDENEHGHIKLKDESDLGGDAVKVDPSEEDTNPGIKPLKIPETEPVGEPVVAATSETISLKTFLAQKFGKKADQGGAFAYFAGKQSLKRLTREGWETALATFLNRKIGS